MEDRKRRRHQRKKRRQQELKRRLCLLLLSVLIILGICIGIKIIKSLGNKKIDGENKENIDWTGAPQITVDLLSISNYTRPGTSLSQVKGLVIHYTANPSSSAKANRDYFESLSHSHERKASSHFIVGLSGEVIQCIPTKEISYASNDRNIDTISIECCHPDDTGKFKEETYSSLVKLSGWLCARYKIKKAEIIRHYDVTGKMCPLYYVEHEDAWERLKEDICAYADSL